MITKAKPTTGKIVLILCTAMMATSLQVSARPPRARVQRGTIEAIDHNSRTLQIQGTSESTALTLVWNDRTRFIEGSRTVTAAKLARRQPVAIWYRSPFFGERFATKIVIEGAASHSAKK